MDMSALHGSSAVLTTLQVAALEKLTVRQVQFMCRTGTLDPVRKFGRYWLIGEGYFYSKPAPWVAPNGLNTIIIPDRRKPGRPKGAKNKKPYPKGVKRPRK